MNVRPECQHLPRGWCHHCDHLLNLLEQHQPKVIVELGTHLGASAIAMARVMRAWQGTLYCVDTWHGKPKPHARYPHRIYECATNMTIADVNPYVRLIPATTKQAAEAWQGPMIDFLYIDATHSYEGCMSDLTLWWPHVKSGGVIAGDDYDHPRYPGVNQAWDEFEWTHNISFNRLETPNTNPPGMRLVYGVKP